jgi:hypothetical protein
MRLLPLTRGRASVMGDWQEHGLEYRIDLYVMSFSLLSK